MIYAKKKSKSTISSRSTENNEQTRKKNIIEKIASRLEKNYHQFIKRFNLTYLIKIIKEIIEKQQGFKNFDLNNDYPQIEVSILEKLGMKIDQKEENSKIQNHTINENYDSLVLPNILDVRQASNEGINKEFSQNSLNLIPYPSKVELYKNKREDIWAKHAIDDYNEYQNEIKKQKIKIEEKKKLIQDMLLNQVQEKKEKISKNKKEEEYYINLQNENNKKYDFLVQEKLKSYQEKISNFKEIREKFVQEKKQLNILNETKLKEEEQKLLENIRIGIEKEKIKIEKKKFDEREKLLQSLRENEELKILKIKNQSQTETETNIENASFLKFSVTPNIKSKFKLDQSETNLEQKKHKKNPSKNDEKYIEEMAEIEDLKRKKDLEKQQSKVQEIKRIKDSIENQILLKKRRIEEEKLKDKSYQLKILEDVENFKKNYEVVERKVKETNKKYQNDLLKQIYDKKTKLDCSH